MAEQPLSLDAWAVLALLCEEDRHGWALVRALAPDGEVGRVWSVRRAVVYRTVELLLDMELVQRAGVEPGSRGSPRTLLRPGPQARSALARWLTEPVPHVRDLRSALLLKLLFSQRAGRSNRRLLQAQRKLLTRTVAALETTGDADGAFEPTMRAFRLETARAGLRFVEGELGAATGGGTTRRRV